VIFTFEKLTGRITPACPLMALATLGLFDRPSFKANARRAKLIPAAAAAERSKNSRRVLEVVDWGVLSGFNIRDPSRCSGR